MTHGPIVTREHRSLCFTCNEEVFSRSVGKRWAWLDANGKEECAPWPKLEDAVLVSPARAAAIKSFRRSVALLEEAFGLKLKTDSSGDLLIIDTTVSLPDGYEWSAWIDRAGKLHIAEFVTEAANEVQS